MKITYIKLENVAGLMVGSNISNIEIDLSKSKNKIIAIQAPNGCGKSVLLSSLSPFSGVTNVDDRSSLSYIIPKKQGYKEIHYSMGKDKIIIKHYYKPTKDDGHSIKSYFSLNGDELNENGNVTSFLSLVEMHMGLTTEMMRLIRLGTNVNSFISLTPAKRKEYIGKLIEEIDTYLKIYKKINEDIRVLKVLTSSNNQNLLNCHISDLVVENDNLKNLFSEIKLLEKERDKVISKISKITSLMKENDINDLRKKKQEVESSILEFEKTLNKIKELSLENKSIDDLIKNRNELSNQKIDIQSKINSYRLSIDSSLKSIERLEVTIKKITSNNDIQSLLEAIISLKESLSNTNKVVMEFKPIGNTTSDDISYMINKLASFNQISNMIYTFGNKPVEIYLKLKQENRSVDSFLKEQTKKNNSSINENDIKLLFDHLFENDAIIMPNCDTEYKDCPYYRFSDLILNIKDKLDEETLDGETLRYIQIISNNIDNILNDIDKMNNIHIPDSLKENLTESSILKRLENKFSFFDLSHLQEYLSLIREYEIYIRNKDKLKEYEYQLSIYKKSGIDSHLSEINQYKDSIDFYNKNINTLNKDIINIDLKLEIIDQEIGLVTKYNDGKKYQSMFKSSLETTNKILIPLENASNEKMQLDFELRELDERINRLRKEHKNLENKINEYKRLVVEAKKLDDKYNELNMILESTSTKKGIPVIYMKKYLGKIQKMANNLLKLIYEDNLQLSKFVVTPDSFEVPYIKNGKKIPDVKYSSQSEIALITMALSFALSNKATGNYNILLLDEIDSGLDQTNRVAFLKMLYMQMDLLNAEQVFIISQNLDQMINVPMDVIRLSDTGVRSRLQNIIYDLQKEG